MTGAAARALWGWAAANRLLPVTATWVAGLGLLAIVGDPALIATAARAMYLLLAVYAVRLLVTETGQPSLGHAAFAATGAYATAALRLRFGLDGATAAVAAAALGGAMGLAVGWGAARMRLPMVALLTWALGWLVFVALGAFPQATGGLAGISLRAPMRVRWDALGVDFAFNDFGHLLLGSALLALVLLLYRSAQDSTIGRRWAALRDSSTLARSLGHDVARTRRWTFACSAALVALAGSLGAQLLQVVDPSLFSPLQSLNLFVAVLIGAPLGFFGPVVGAAVASGAPVAVDYAGQLTGLPLGTGRQLTAAALTVLALAISLRLSARHRSVVSPGPAAVAIGSSAAAPPRPREVGEPRLVATSLVVQFDGLRALDGASLSVSAGAIHGLVGPNGSGKTTMLRVLAGTVAQGGGTVTLDGTSLDGLDEADRVRVGVVRTFQRTAVMPHLRALDHVEAGMLTTYRDATALQAVLKSPGYRAAAADGRERAASLLETFGLAGAAGSLPEQLSSGRQRLLQMATAVATNPRVLLLDEPAAGMSEDEISLLHRALVGLAGGGLTILLIEHNLRFLAGIADRVTVMEGGRVITVGTPAEVSRDPEVRRAYLGINAAPMPRPRSATRTRRRSTRGQ